MLYIAQIKNAAGEDRWAIAVCATGKIVRKYYEPGRAIYTSKQQAEQHFEEVLLAYEAEGL